MTKFAINTKSCIINYYLLFQPELLKNVVTSLEKINFVTDRLSLGDSKFMVILV